MNEGREIDHAMENWRTRREAKPPVPYSGREDVLQRRDRRAMMTTLLLLTGLLLARDSIPEPPMDFLRPRWTISAAEVGATQEWDLRPYGWGVDGCGTMWPLYDDLHFSLRAWTDYEVREVPDHPDHPITIVSRTGFSPGRTSEPIMPVLWDQIRQCAESDPPPGRVSFEALGSAPEPDATTALFGWRATVAGPWREAYDPGDAIVAPGFTPREGAEFWYLEMWFALVDGDLLVVAGTEGPKPPVLDARELVDTVVGRLNEDMPARQICDGEWPEPRCHPEND